MATITTDLDLEVPVSTAYRQWTQFETFPQFMEGVKEVRQFDPTHHTWRAEIGGKEETWDAEIVEQIPDRRIAWRSVNGVPNAGTVDFRPLDANRSNVSLTMDYEPQGLTESIGSALGFDHGRVKGDLERFRALVETQGASAGTRRDGFDRGPLA